ncbi:hypothetical protein BKA61DRAFT_520003 [Leptodontidium sp. MPI-SDFR-AT-0119]|nr:hypothetical protein BKA61DRAFT_520003 [Leptodontidium sp. MPI-SDFR-AT-0119]
MVSGPLFRNELQSATSSGFNRRNDSSNLHPGGIDETSPLIGRGNFEPPPEPFHRLRILLGHVFASSDSEFRIISWPSSALVTLFGLLATSYLHVLLIFLPFAILATLLHWNPMTQLVFGCLSIIPLSSLTDSVTYEISLRCGQTVGGLLSAILASTVEISFGIVALSHNEIDFLQATLLGHVVCCTLLGLGLSFTTGGLRFHEQEINSAALMTLSFSISVATTSTVLPTILNFIVSRFGKRTEHDMTALSLALAIVLLAIYILYLFYQLRTHTELFDEDEPGIEAEEYDEPTLSSWSALLVLVVVIFLLVICWQSIVSNIGAIAAETHVSKAFVGFVLIPLICNAKTLFTTVRLAHRDKLSLVVDTTIALVLQILLFVLPILTVLGWIMNCELRYVFGMLQVVCLLAATLTMTLVLPNGRSTYLEGVFCLALYVIIIMTMLEFSDDAGL